MLARAKRGQKKRGAKRGQPRSEQCESSPGGCLDVGMWIESESSEEGRGEDEIKEREGRGLMGDGRMKCSVDLVSLILLIRTIFAQ